MKKLIQKTVLLLFTVAAVASQSFSFAATTDFTASEDITISDVIFNGSVDTADLIILNGSSAESWTIDSGVFTVTNPDSVNTFKVGSTSVDAKTIAILNASSEIIECAVNSTPGTSYVTLSTTAATYTVKPSVTTDCQFLCSVIEGATSYTAYPDCAASACQSGYQVSGGTCVASGSGGSGGGGGSGSTVDLTTPYKLPTTVSSSTVSIYKPLDLSGTGGDFPRPVKIYNYYDHDLAVQIQQNSKATTFGGASYAGQIAAPKSFSTSPTENTTGIKTHAVLTVGSSDKYLQFDKPVELTIPFTLDEDADISKIKVFCHDSVSNSYQLAGDGGTVSSDQKSITVKVDHFSTFVVFETDEDEVAFDDSSTQQLNDLSTAFSDITGEWFTSFVEKLVSWGAVSGYPDGTYRPADSTNRAEMAKIIAEAFDLTIPTNLTEDPFPDVSKDEWFAPFVAAVKDAGIVSGYEDGDFRPADSINRAEALKMAIAATGQSAPANSTEQFSDVPTDAWYARFVALAKENSIVSGSPATQLVAGEGAELFMPDFLNHYSLGSTDDGVRNLKLVLQQLGYFSETIDENYDKVIVEAVKTYQIAAGISPVGSFGPLTRKNLNQKVATENIQISESGNFIKETIYLFRPADPVNRAEIAKIVVQAKESF